jgi:hypothetical protein
VRGAIFTGTADILPAVRHDCAAQIFFSATSAKREAIPRANLLCGSAPSAFAEEAVQKLCVDLGVGGCFRLD